MNLDGYWVCVVVVLVVVVGVVQPDSDDAMTTAAKPAMISFFISIIFVWIWFVTSTAHRYAIGRSSAMACNPTKALPPMAWTCLPGTACRGETGEDGRT